MVYKQSMFRIKIYLSVGFALAIYNNVKSTATEK